MFDKAIKLQTQVKCASVAKKFGYESVITGIGSCFAENILSALYDTGFKGMQNPNGILYNAASIATALGRALSDQAYVEGDFFEFSGLWHSYLHHGRFSERERLRAVEKAEKSRLEFSKYVEGSSLFIMTSASSVVYRHIDSGQIVANCHKVPDRFFTRSVLGVEENLAYLSSAIESIKKINPACEVILTLSPVRHYPGDLVLNARSKASILSAIHLAVAAFDGVSYFPSYEIVLDELRDYRFFNRDMLHPNELAREIIFERFIDVWFEDEVKEQIKIQLKNNKAKAHRPSKLV